MPPMTETEAHVRFVEWLANRMTFAGRGDNLIQLNVEPSGKFWLGRLQSAQAAASSGLGERGERLEPCAQGFKLKPLSSGPWNISISGKAKVWQKNKNTKAWYKSETVHVSLNVTVPDSLGNHRFGHDNWASALEAITGHRGLAAGFDVEVMQGADGQPELAIVLVNLSPEEHLNFSDTRLYECELRVSGLLTTNFVLEALEDSFRYDRRIPAYGINCGVRVENGEFVSEDAVTADRHRPIYWNVADAEPDLTFATLASDPLPSASKALKALLNWGECEWSETALDSRQTAEGWSNEMRSMAKVAAEQFWEECSRIKRGIELLGTNKNLARAFRAMNRAIDYSANGNYSGWRPFQFGFLLANLSAVVDPSKEEDIADIVWFATGGGKTETYLGLLVTAALYDRLRGKTDGITAWSRFPLRMLSLQQTQRFADAMAAAELVRKDEEFGGEPFSMGFFIGRGATPNRIPEQPKEGDPDPDDDAMPARYQVLETCPFCHSHSLEMGFDRKIWRLEHRCTNDTCPWTERALPIYVVDEDVYRFLPTVVVGTLDKAASISIQAAMRGLVGAPLGICSKPGHGYTYAPRSARKNGCLVPGCSAEKADLPMPAELYPPSFRLQDELHLLRDSLGAVDAHYEALYDSLEKELAGRRPKILASSATLSGYEKQVEVLYRRAARVFPVPPPRATAGFWTADSNTLMRRFVALAPRGVTVEYTVDRLLTELQTAIRLLIEAPNEVCSAAGIDASFAPTLLSHYGTNVVYGNTLRDLEAVARSMETQFQAKGPLQTASLTGNTDFAEVRETLERLQNPEADFYDRLHVITASSMMSHGVDVNRLNVMVMLGLPLATAEFIQATARVGRRYPALVFVVHKIGRERDAGIFRSFKQFVQQGDRFVDPIPITRRSRRVLERTLAGLVLARLLAVHEPGAAHPLTTASALKKYWDSGHYDLDAEVKALVEALALEGDLDTPMCEDIASWIEEFKRNLDILPTDAKWISDLSPSGSPMLSLRDVEKSIPIFGRRV